MRHDSFLLVKHQTPALLLNPIQQVINLLPHAFQAMHGCVDMVVIRRLCIVFGYATKALNSFDVIASQDNVLNDL
jgi:hypothetical protein